MKHGLILFAHGARDPRWAEPFQQVADAVARQCPQACVRLAFLELMQPSLPEAAAQLLAHGCSAITVQPLFLGTGGHLRRDLPALMASLEQAHSGVHWRLRPAIGEHPDVIDAMAQASVRALGAG